MKQDTPRGLLRKSGITLRQFKDKLKEIVSECDCQCLDVEMSPDEIKALLDQLTSTKHTNK